MPSTTWLHRASSLRQICMNGLSVRGVPNECIHFDCIRFKSCGWKKKLDGSRSHRFVVNVLKFSISFLFV